MADVILHAFNWNYAEVAAEAGTIAANGFGAVLLPPPLYSKEDSHHWWQRYQPKDYRVVRSFLGSKGELENAIHALHDHGIRIFADIVFNHMANEKSWRNPKEGYTFPGDTELARYRNERESFERDRLYGTLDHNLFGPQDFNNEKNIQCWEDLYEATERWLSGLPDLDLNERVVEQQKTCLRALNDLGFDGYRIDAIKHLPEEHLSRVFETEDMRGKFLFGESLTCNDAQEDLFIWPLLREIDVSFYDFPLHETLRRVFSPCGSMRELVNPAAFHQALPWHRAVTFSVTHDIPYNDCFRGQLLHPQDEFLTNAYLLGRDGGVPLVFSDHNESALAYQCDRDRWCAAWKRSDIVGMIAFHNAVHGTPQRSLFEADGFLVFARGDRGIVAINKTEEWQHPRIWTCGLRHGRYRCQLHRHDMQVGGDYFEFALPPRQAQMWLCRM
ncbi:MAG: alpha-amylase family protein [Nitrospirales bacterium]|nr:alpha-amylase family protein [Nitrospirales bacterium]